MSSSDSENPPAAGQKRAIQEACEKSRKRQKRAVASQSAEEFLDTAKITTRFVSPFSNLRKVIHVGFVDLGLFSIPSGEPVYGPLTEADTRVKERDEEDDELALKQFRLILEFAPSLRDVLVNLEDPDEAAAFISDLQKQLHAARHTDTNKVKKGIPDCITSNYTNKIFGFVHDVPDTLPIIPFSKGQRGFYSRVYARLLCPKLRLEEFDADPDYHTKILGGQVAPVTADHWPHFMYGSEDETLLCQGELLYQAAETILLGNSDRFRSGKKTRRTTLKQLGIKKFNAAFIAYCACQVYSNLGSNETWAPVIGSFSLTDFFSSILDEFELEAEWGAATIDIWNRRYLDDAPQPTAAPAAALPPPFPEPNSARARHRAMKMAKKQAEREKECAERAAEEAAAAAAAA